MKTKLITCTLLAAATLLAQNTAPDNTKVNKRDVKTSTPITSEQQGNSKEDLDITKRIRASLTSEKSLSTYAKNIKVITMQGNVTLRGPVRSDAEKDMIMAKASDIAGPTHVINHLDVAAKPAK